MKYFKKIVGNLCYLSPVSFSDLEKYTEWVNDTEIGMYVLFSSNVIDMYKERETLEQLVRHDIVLSIIDRDSDLPIGICGLHDRSQVHRSAVLGIFIGEKSYWGRGFGTEATMLLLDFAFNVLNLNSVVLEVSNFNKRAILCYEKCGFKFVGKKRKAIYTAGEYHDLYVYDILASEFHSPTIKELYHKVVSENEEASRRHQSD